MSVLLKKTKKCLRIQATPLSKFHTKKRGQSSYTPPDRTFCRACGAVKKNTRDCSVRKRTIFNNRKRSYRPLHFSACLSFFFYDFLAFVVAACATYAMCAIVFAALRAFDHSGKRKLPNIERLLSLRAFDTFLFGTAIKIHLLDMALSCCSLYSFYFSSFLLCSASNCSNRFTNTGFTSVFGQWQSPSFKSLPQRWQSPRQFSLQRILGGIQFQEFQSIARQHPVFH